MPQEISRDHAQRPPVDEEASLVAAHPAAGPAGEQEAGDPGDHFSNHRPDVTDEGGRSPAGVETDLGDQGRDPVASAIPSTAGSHGPHGHGEVVLRLAGAQALAAGHTLLDPAALEDAGRGRGLTHHDLFVALQTLVQAGLVDMHFVKPSLITLLRLTPAGLRSHLSATRPDLADVRRRVLAALREGAVGWQGGAPVDLAGAVGEQSLLVEVVMEDLRREGHVVFSPAAGRRLRVHRLVE